MLRGQFYPLTCITDTHSNNNHNTTTQPVPHSRHVRQQVTYKDISISRRHDTLVMLASTHTRIRGARKGQQPWSVGLSLPLFAAAGATKNCHMKVESMYSCAYIYIYSCAYNILYIYLYKCVRSLVYILQNLLNALLQYQYTTDIRRLVKIIGL